MTMQKTEHIRKYEEIVDRFISRPGPDRHYWEGCRDMLLWVQQPESEFFDPRLDRTKKIDDQKIPRK